MKQLDRTMAQQVAEAIGEFPKALGGRIFIDG